MAILLIYLYTYLYEPDKIALCTSLTWVLLGSRVRVLAVGTGPYLLSSPLQCPFEGVAADCVHHQLVGDASGLASQLHLPTLTTLHFLLNKHLKSVRLVFIFAFYHLFDQVEDCRGVQSHRALYQASQASLSDLLFPFTEVCPGQNIHDTFSI